MSAPGSRTIGGTAVIALLTTLIVGCDGAAPSTSLGTTTRPIATAAAETSDSGPQRDYWPTDGWITTTPEEQGMTSAVLADMLEQIEVHEYAIDSVTIIRNGYLVLDATFHPFPPNTKHIIHSCTKSVVGTLVGMLIDDGTIIESVDQPVVELVPTATPDEVDELKASITVEDLLTMSSGLRCRDSYLYEWEGLNQMRASEDWAAHVLALEMSEEPGTRFEYCNGSSHLLSRIISETSGVSAFEFATETLFLPLGIGDVFWPANDDGVNHGWGDMRLHPGDMAKFGFLYLNDGWWNGERRLPAGWVGSATTPHITAGTLNDWYGYQWWIDNTTYSALGFGGQYIIVSPSIDTVAVFTSGLSGSEFEVPRDLFDRYVVGAIVGDDPLPINESANERIRELVAAAAAAPVPVAPDANPPAATELAEQRWTFEPNDGAFAWFEFEFGIDEARLQLEDVDGPIDVLVGLDGVPRISDTWGHPWAFTGQWVDDNTFLVSWQSVGGAGRGTFEFVFNEDGVAMVFNSATSGSTARAIALSG